MKIRELREARGISQAQLAKDLSVAQNTISQWENGARSLDQTTLIKLSKYFDVSIDYLLDQPTSQLPHSFSSAEDAIKFLLSQKYIEAFGNWDISSLTDDQVTAFANDVLVALKIVGHQYKNKKE